MTSSIKSNKIILEISFSCLRTFFVIWTRNIKLIWIWTWTNWVFQRKNFKEWNEWNISIFMKDGSCTSWMGRSGSWQICKCWQCQLSTWRTLTQFNSFDIIFRMPLVWHCSFASTVRGKLSAYILMDALMQKRFEENLLNRLCWQYNSAFEF